MGKNGSGSVGKAGRDGYQAPPMDLYRRQVIYLILICHFDDILFDCKQNINQIFNIF
jgi:hypothetical protein